MSLSSPKKSKLERVLKATSGDQFSVRPTKQYMTRYQKDVRADEIFTSWVIVDEQSLEAKLFFHVNDITGCMEAFNTNGKLLLAATRTFHLEEETNVCWLPGLGLGRINKAYVTDDSTSGRSLKLSHKPIDVITKGTTFTAHAGSKVVGKIYYDGSGMKLSVEQKRCNPLEKILLLVYCLKLGHGDFRLNEQPVPFIGQRQKRIPDVYLRNLKHIASELVLKGACKDKNGNFFYEAFNDLGKIELVFSCKMEDEEICYKGMDVHGVLIFHARSTEGRLKVYSSNEKLLGTISDQNIYDQKNVKLMRDFFSRGERLTIRTSKYRELVAVSQRDHTVCNFYVDYDVPHNWKILILSAIVHDAHTFMKLPKMPRADSYVFADLLNFITPAIMSMVY